MTAGLRVRFRLGMPSFEAQVGVLQHAPPDCGSERVDAVKGRLPARVRMGSGELARHGRRPRPTDDYLSKAGLEKRTERRGSYAAAMAIYGERILPRIINAACGMKVVQPLRRQVCEGLEGDVVEIGFGSALDVAL